MKSMLAGSFVFLLGVAAVADDKVKPPKIGEIAPPIQLRSVLQAPPGAKPTWESMRGKVVVLEFWATSCGPCVGAISHMNELVDTLKDRPVHFIAITDEDEPTIKDFLKKKPIHGWVGLDDNQSMSKAYGVEWIPQTVIIGPDGKIAAVTHPIGLEAEHLENVLAGKDSGLGAPSYDDDRPTVPTVKPNANEPPAFFQFVIRPSASGQQSGTGGNAGTNELGLVYETQMTGAMLKDLLPGTYGVTPSCLSIESPLYEGRLDVQIRVPRESIHEMAGLGRQVIESTFGLTSRRETREIEVYVLTAKPSRGTGLRSTVLPESYYTSFAPGNVEAINVTLDVLITDWLNHVLKKPVVDETGLKGGYDLELKWDVKEDIANDPTKLIEAVREQLGLELTLAKRPKEVVVVTRK
jgi:uncharacterized protein (TIGR03435 family)